MSELDADAERRVQFQALYIECLRECVRTMPKLYAFSEDAVPAVAERMFVALYKGSFNHDSPAFRLLAKKLGIKPTRSAIVAAWEGHP